MNSVPEHMTDEVTENAVSIDRRRGMKLIPCASSKKQSSLRIDVDDSLLKPAAMSPDGRIQTSRTRNLPANELVSVRRSAIALAAMAGLAIGFLLGRRREG